MSGSLPSGLSEVDTVAFRLVDRGAVITNWSKYDFTSKFLTPASAWSFTTHAGDAASAALLVPGARVELAINGAVQCSGTIDRRTTESDASGGTMVTVQGRDILGPVVDSNVDPAFHFAAGMTIVDVVGAVLAPFNINKIYNSDEANINAVTGYARGKGPPPTVATTVTAHVAPSTAVTQIKGTQVIVANSKNRPDLRNLTVQQAKPHLGEGCYAYLERLLKRLGLAMWAMADGSGVVIDKPNFEANYQQQVITHRRNNSASNNVKHGSGVIDLASQPSVIVAFGKGGGKDTAKCKLICIMVNELTGLASTGNPLAGVLQIIARYPAARRLDLRKEISMRLRKQGDPEICKPLFLNDDESQNLEQLEAFTRREMANKQRKAVTASYELKGHTFDGHPWAWGLNVAVNDEVTGIQQSMWVESKTFTKSTGGGTTSKVDVILPYTAAIG